MNLHKNYQMIVFDWDGTLMDSGDKIANCFIGAARDAGIRSPDPDQVKRYVGLNLSIMFENIYPEIEDHMILKLVNGYREHWLDIDSTPMPLYAGVEQGLRALQNQGYLLAIATGKSRNGLDRVLKQTGLEDLFVYSRCADEARSKPHPQMLHDILNFTGTDSVASIMVGDTTFDMQMAKNAGMDCIGIGHGYHDKKELELSSDYPVAESFDKIAEIFFQNRKT